MPHVTPSFTAPSPGLHVCPFFHCTPTVSYTKPAFPVYEKHNSPVSYTQEGVFAHEWADIQSNALGRGMCWSELTQKGLCGGLCRER